MLLNRMKSFGRISGDLFIPDGCDRPASFEQDGKFFDAHGRVIEPGVKIEEPPEEDHSPVPGTNVADLLHQAESMHWRKFKATAQEVLGPECPATKAAIIEALVAVQKEFDARGAKRARERGQPVPTTPSTGVDLAAWARGQREYLWGEVRKAIKGEFGRNVAERDDAVEFLIGQGVVTANEARRDVLREAS
tara:strand:- start:261 stop:836 length:576 start_codon:yes stop_codon:yes gene_type:complete